MTILNINNGELAKRIIIEGPDAVGKDTFIAKLFSFIDGVDSFDGLNKLIIPHPQKELANNVIVPAYNETINKYSNMLSYKSIHSRDGSRESKLFCDALDSGEITNQLLIAEEYLQVHFDLENYAKDLDTYLSMVVMNRSLISYYAMQIHALDLNQFKDKWQFLWDQSRQSEALYVRLTAPEDIVHSRLASRQGADFRGDLENFYMTKWNKIEEGFVNFQNAGYCKNTITIDTSVNDTEIAKQIDSIVHWVVASELNESVTRSLGI